jgi:hypothetical protein
MDRFSIGLAYALVEYGTNFGLVDFVNDTCICWTFFWWL